MNLRTPKRYTSRGRRRRLLNLRWWWLYVLTPIVVFIGAGIWQNQEMFRAPIEAALATQAQSIADNAATSRAPTATPTDSPLNYLAIANAAYERGAMETAIDNYLLAAEGLPNDVAVFFRLAHLLITNDRVAEALEVADRAINADPFSALGWAVRGMALDWDGQTELALASLLHAVELDPQSAVAHALLAETYIDLGAPDRALQMAEQALALDPTDYNVQRNYGYVLEWGYAEYDEAIQAYERALQLAPSRAYIAFNLADLYYREGDYAAEVELLQAVVDQNPENASAHYRLAVALYRDLGEVEQARAAVERCTAIAPDKVSCLSFLGALQRRDGEYNLCARTLDRAVEAGSTNPIDYYFAGTCYIVIDDCNRAEQILRLGLALAETTETQTDIRDALAQCQVVLTLPPTAAPEGTPDAAMLDGTPAPDAN